MISQFPQFKELELVDKEEIEQITSKYPPYSDFNFISMWSWDVNRDMRISKLNDNLVVRFTDYLTGSPFFSFLGDNMVNETALTLLEFSKKEGLNTELKLIPEEVVKILDQNKFKIVEDRDHFDYIFDLEKISSFEGSEYSRKRNKVNQFVKLYPNVKIEIFNVKDPLKQELVLTLDQIWTNHKIQKDYNFNTENEIKATKRFFEYTLNSTLGVGVFLEDKLIGYSISEIMPNGNAISHFSKADVKYNGIYDFLMRENAKILLNKGYNLLNFEQDLGLLGLRESKKSFMPTLLKKFAVALP